MDTGEIAIWGDTIQEHRWDCYMGRDHTWRTRVRLLHGERPYRETGGIFIWGETIRNTCGLYNNKITCHALTTPGSLKRFLIVQLGQYKINLHYDHNLM